MDGSSMSALWFKREDWPQPHEIEQRSGLMDAIRALPGTKDMSDPEIEDEALWLLKASVLAANEDLSRNRPASKRQTENEIAKLMETANRLRDHIATLHSPAISALYYEGVDVLDASRMVGELAEYARRAFPGDQFSTDVSGARPKIQASEVARTAAQMFREITGTAPTFTSDPDTGEVSSLWPDFLASVFKALWISASVGAQVRALRKKNGTS